MDLMVALLDALQEFYERLPIVPLRNGPRLPLVLPLISGEDLLFVSVGQAIVVLLDAAAVLNPGLLWLQNLGTAWCHLGDSIVSVAVLVHGLKTVAEAEAEVIVLLQPHLLDLQTHYPRAHL
jgi:hypothetical protein